jgi:hypothetical protein
MHRNQEMTKLTGLLERQAMLLPFLVVSFREVLSSMCAARLFTGSGSDCGLGSGNYSQRGT